MGLRGITSCLLMLLYCCCRGGHSETVTAALTISGGNSLSLQDSWRLNQDGDEEENDNMTTPSSLEPETYLKDREKRDMMLKIFTQYVISWVYPLTLMVGLLGLGLTLLTMARVPSALPTTTRMWITAMLCSNAIFLVVGGGYYWSRAVLRYDFRLAHPILCPLHSFLTYFLVHVCSWFQGCLCTERIIVVLAPLKVRSWLTPRRTAVTLVLVLALISAWNTPVLLHRKAIHWFDDISNTTWYVCTTATHKQQQTISLIDSILGIYTPFAMMVLSTVIIGSSLSRRSNSYRPSRKERNNEVEGETTTSLMTADNEPNQQMNSGRTLRDDIITVASDKTMLRWLRQRRRSRKLSIMMVAMNILFLVSNMPMTCMTIVANANLQSSFTSSTVAFLQRFFLFLALMNNAFNWLMVTLSGKQFRRGLHHSMWHWRRDTDSRAASSCDMRPGAAGGCAGIPSRRSI